MLRRSAIAAGALLGAFHVWLLGNQAWTGQLAEPDVVLRWLAGAVLVCGLAALRRRGAPVLFGRQAVAIWVLAALLHGPALANDLDGLATPSLPEAVTTVVQLAALLSVPGLALVLLAALGAWRAVARAITPGGACVRLARTLETDAGLGFLPRPPPVA